MNHAVVRELLDKALTRKIPFAEILGTLTKEGVESYHVDFLRNECCYYTRGGESLVVNVAFAHAGVATEFSAEKLEDINKRVQAGYSDFVSEGTAAGCACYTVYLYGKKVRYFGRDGDEYVQYFPGSK